MSKRLDVPIAIKALVLLALPDAEVFGPDDDGSVPDRIPPDGRAVIECGDPGDPEIDLSPLTYNYEHVVPVTLSAMPDLDLKLTAQQVLDARITLIANRIMADRTLGGLVDFLDAAAPAATDVYSAGSPLAASAVLALVATYATTRPL